MIICTNFPSPLFCDKAPHEVWKNWPGVSEKKSSFNYLLICLKYCWMTCRQCRLWSGTCTVWSVPSLSANRIIGYYRMYKWRANTQMILCTCAGWPVLCMFKATFLAHLNNVHGELLYYPRCWRQLPQMLKFSLKFLKTSYFLTLPPICFIFGMMIHIGPKFCAVPSPPL